MKSYRFALGFLISLFVVLFGLSFTYLRFYRNSDVDVLTGIWAAMILVVVLFGVVSISLVINRLRARKVLKKQILEKSKLPKISVKMGSKA